VNIQLCGEKGTWYKQHEMKNFALFCHLVTVWACD